MLIKKIPYKCVLELSKMKIILEVKVAKFSRIDELQNTSSTLRRLNLVASIISPHVPYYCMCLPVHIVHA